MNDTNKERAEFEAWYFAETDSRLFCESQWRAWQARAAKAPAAQPVAWLVYLPSEDAQRIYDSQDDIGYVDDLTNNADAKVIPLYTAQPSAAAAAKAPAAPTHAAQRDELLQAAIDFIGTLTGMTPPPIEVAPPEVFAPFYEFVDRVQAITGAAPPAPTEQWIGVTERLPEWVHRDDTPCYINGKEVPPTLTSKTVLVALDGGGVRTDKLTTIEGKSNGWWHTFGERVVAWQDTPAPPQGAAKGAT